MVAIISHDWSNLTGAGRCAGELKAALAGAPEVVYEELAGVPERGAGRRQLTAKLLRAWCALRALRRQRVDVVIVNTTIQATMVLAAWLSGARVIWWCHESGASLSGGLMRARLLVYEWLAHGRVAASGAVPQSRLKTCVIRNVVSDRAMPTARRPARTDDARDILVLGTKSSTKGTDRLPTLLPASRFDQDRQLLVVGGEDSRDVDLLHEVQAHLEKSWSERLEWRPAIDDVEEAYSRAAVLVLPSRSDTRPRVVEEALSRGIPVVATSLPGLVEIAETTTDGTALTLMQDDDDWAPAVCAALARGRSGRSLIKEFSAGEFRAAWVQAISAAAP